MKTLTYRICELKNKIQFAEKNNKPLVLKKLKAEMESLLAMPSEVEINNPVVKMDDTVNNKAAFLFYNA